MGRTIGFAYRLVRRVFVSIRGATALEYALLIALIAVSATMAFQLIGSNTAGTFGNTAAALPPEGFSAPDPNKN